MKQAGLFGDRIELDVVLDHIREHPGCTMFDLLDACPSVSATDTNLAVGDLQIDGLIYASGEKMAGEHNQPSTMWRLRDG